MHLSLLLRIALPLLLLHVAPAAFAHPGRRTVPGHAVHRSAAANRTLPHYAYRSQQIPRKYSDAPTVEIALIYDRAYCTRFKFNQAAVDSSVQTLISQAEDILRPKTGIHLKIEFHEAPCITLQDATTHDPFSINEMPLQCNQSKQACNAPSRILLALRRAWAARKLRKDSYDVVVLLTGSTDGTPVSGAAYANSVCNSAFGFAWIEALPTFGQGGPTDAADANAATLAHELAHLLGAPHDERGIMRSVITPGERVNLSDASARSINHFVAKDHRAWCVSRASGDNARWTSEEWNDLRYDFPTRSVLDIAVTSSHHKNPLHVFVLYGTPRKVQYSVLKLDECNGGVSKCIASERAFDRYIDVRYGCVDCRYGAIALGSLPSSKGVDVFIGYTRQNHASAAGIDGYYVVGKAPAFVEEDPLSWSAVKVPGWPVPLNDLYAPQGTADEVYKSKFPMYSGLVSIATGSISNAKATDLVWMWMDEVNGRMVVRYKVAFNLDRKGSPIDGWSDDMSVPGWFGRQSKALHATVHNVGGSAQPDLIVFLRDETNPGRASYYCVGRDLNAIGHVTKGWSNFMRVPDQKGLVNGQEKGLKASGVAIAQFNSEFPLLVIPKVVRAGYSGSVELQLISSSKWSARLSYEEPKFFTAERDVTTRCFECYSGDMAYECSKKVKVCSSWMDVVRMDDRTRSRNQRTKTKTTLTRTRITDRKRRMKSVLRPEIQGEHRTDSIPCNGFNYLYRLHDTNRNGCDLTDFRKVMAIGLLLAFKETLQEQGVDAIEILRIDETNMEAGTGGSHSKSEVASVSVKDANWNVSNAVQIAILRMKAKYSDFKRIFEGIAVINMKRGFYRIDFLIRKPSGGPFT